jgi:uncharacterized protein (TIGR02594 family)
MTKTSDSVLADRCGEATGGSRPSWLIKALSYVGTCELAAPRNNPTIMGWAKKLGGDIGRHYNDDGIPWCALFANAVLHEDGKKGTGTLWALDFAKWGQRLQAAAVGALACMTRNGGGHVTIVVGRDQHGNLMCCGGNQSDAVSVKPFDPKRVISYRWPSEVPLPIEIGFDELPLVTSDGVRSTNEA